MSTQPPANLRVAIAVIVAMWMSVSAMLIVEMWGAVADLADGSGDGRWEVAI